MNLTAAAVGVNLSDITADDAAVNAPLLTFPTWLAFALSDLTCLVANLFCSKPAEAVKRADVLSSWGLFQLAEEMRTADADAAAAKSRAAMIEFARAWKARIEKENHGRTD